MPSERRKLRAWWWWLTRPWQYAAFCEKRLREHECMPLLRATQEQREALRIERDYWQRAARVPSPGAGEEST